MATAKIATEVKTCGLHIVKSWLYNREKLSWSKKKLSCIIWELYFCPVLETLAVSTFYNVRIDGKLCLSCMLEKQGYIFCYSDLILNYAVPDRLTLSSAELQESFLNVLILKRIVPDLYKKNYFHLQDVVYLKIVIKFLKIQF